MRLNYTTTSYYFIEIFKTFFNIITKLLSLRPSCSGLSISTQEGQRHGNQKGIHLAQWYT